MATQLHVQSCNQEEKIKNGIISPRMARNESGAEMPPMPPSSISRIKIIEGLSYATSSPNYVKLITLI